MCVSLKQNYWNRAHLAVLIRNILEFWLGLQSLFTIHHFYHHYCLPQQKRISIFREDLTKERHFFSTGKICSYVYSKILIMMSSCKINNELFRNFAFTFFHCPNLSEITKSFLVLIKPKFNSIYIFLNGKFQTKYEIGWKFESQLFCFHFYHFEVKLQIINKQFTLCILSTLL